MSPRGGRRRMTHAFGSIDSVPLAQVWPSGKGRLS
jgi:hypothetical protein